MRNNNVLIIAYFVFASILVASITLAAIHSAKYGLLWWYLLPTFTTFCCVVGCSSDSRKGGPDGK